jgi:hypothetical protein
MRASSGCPLLVLSPVACPGALLGASAFSAAGASIFWALCAPGECAAALLSCSAIVSVAMVAGGDSESIPPI